MTLSIRQLAEAMPDCNVLIKTPKGNVVYNGLGDELPDHLADEIPKYYIYAPMEKTVKITLDVKPWMRVIVKDVRGNVLFDGFCDETPDELLDMMVIDRFTDPKTMATHVIIDI